MIYFALEGCSDCAYADSLIEEKDFDALFSITRIYSYRDSVKLRDKYKIYKNVYDISWYPSFLILSNDNEVFIGQVSLDKLEDCLLDAYDKLQ